MASPWLVGIEKISEVERTVTMRVEELASVAAWKPSSSARSDANRNTAMATLMTVRNVRRLLRRAFFRTRLMNFMLSSLVGPAHFVELARLVQLVRPTIPFRGAALASPVLRHEGHGSP